MTQYKITNHEFLVKTEFLDEVSQVLNIRWCLGRLNSAKKEITAESPFCKCTDFFVDTIIGSHLNQSGTIYGYKINSDFPVNKRNAVILSDNGCRVVFNWLRCLEKTFEIPKTLIAKDKTKEGYTIFLVSPFWFSCPLFTYIWFFLVRLEMELINLNLQVYEDVCDLIKSYQGDNELTFRHLEKALYTASKQDYSVIGCGRNLRRIKNMKDNLITRIFDRKSKFQKYLKYVDKKNKNYIRIQEHNHSGPLGISKPKSLSELAKVYNRILAKPKD